MPTNNIIDLNIDGIKKTQVRINGRDDSILELDLSDLNFSDRLEKGYQKLQDKIKSMSDIDVDDDNVSKQLKEIDKAMKETVDYIFDSNVSEVCCKSGTMFDMYEGTYRFERILDALIKLYSENIEDEYKKMKKRIKSTTDKYLPQDHKPKANKRKATSKKDE